MKGKLSTHVLDTSEGRPAAGVSIGVWRWQEGKRHLLKTVTTNAAARERLLYSHGVLEPKVN